MEFLKRHYEKLLLAGLLLLFIGSMGWLLVTMKRTGTLTIEQLKLPSREADFVAVDPNNEVFRFRERMFEDIEWKKIEPRNEAFAAFSTDFVIPFAAARCGHCERIIPYYYFEGGRSCPWQDCGKELAKPKIQIGFRSGIPTADDPDGCGIPHDIKMNFRMSIEDPASVLDDLDRDGFSNLYEYKYGLQNGDDGSMIRMSKKHPPMWHRLAVVDTGNIKLPLILKSVNTNGSTDKSRWDIVIDQEGKDRPIETMLADTVNYEGLYLNVKDVSCDPAKPAEATVTLELDGTEMTMKVGENLISGKPLAQLVDIHSGKIFIADTGKRISVGESRSGVTQYEIKRIDMNSNEVFLIENPNRNNPVEVEEPITTRGKIRENERVREKPANDGLGDMMM